MQRSLHYTRQLSPGGLVVSVTDSGGGVRGSNPHTTSVMALSDIAVGYVKKLCISLLLCSFKKIINLKF
jgi:hypothetical protein